MLVTGAAIMGGLIVASLLTLVVVQRIGSAPGGVQASPAPWIGDAVWHRLNPRGYLERRASFGRRAVVNPAPTVVTADDRERAPVWRVPADVRAQKVGSPKDLMKRLLDTPGGGSVNSPTWPVCCEQLATLVYWQGQGESLASIEAETGPLDRAYLDRELDTWGGPNANVDSFKAAGWTDVLGMIRSGDHSGEGVNVYHCRGCGRVYVGACAP